ncbi:peptide chain release factor 1-like, mitochondrial [Neocloeon triangulifer]|uniref:peptide chain release factor 1-like, mitochondrial n=1 Tax=Neocloeon triangulifer TaxID=2078957 RepID=UPI00286F92C1|nr:peptide chain release factor 1-like, mitochondrial [Neocloeon triangulifer]
MLRTVFLLRRPLLLLRKQPVVVTNHSNFIKRTFHLRVCLCAQDSPSVEVSHSHPSLHKLVKKIVDGVETNFPVKQNIKNDLAQLWAARIKLVEDLEQLEKELSKETNEEMKMLADEEKSNFYNEIKDIDSQMVDLLLPSSTLSSKSLFLEVTAGVGGQEAMLFAADMVQMYQGFLQHSGWEFDILELDKSDIGGIRHGSISVSGRGAYEVLCLEAGVHRVQRVPKTEKSGRMHTSTVTVAVLAQPSEIEVVISPKDLKIETKRATGAGGQHVNTTDSAVRIVHLPSGVAVECQSERSQIQNRSLAMQKLRAKLYQMQLDTQEADTKSTRKQQVGSSFRSEKIRTYNFPQDRVTDHRIGKTVHNIRGFLEGGEILSELVEELMARKREEDVKSFFNSLD